MLKKQLFLDLTTKEGKGKAMQGGTEGAPQKIQRIDLVHMVKLLISVDLTFDILRSSLRPTSPWPSAKSSATASCSTAAPTSAVISRILHY